MYFQISQISTEQVTQVETRTRGQANNKLWKDIRLKHITASNVGKICKSTDRRDMIALTHDLITPKNISSKPLKYGRLYEPVAVVKYEKAYNVSTVECGLFISQTNPILAASPDRLLGDDTVIEVKCPYSAREQIISPSTIPYLEYLDGTLQLKQNHDYYYQIQGQMFCTQRFICNLVVYTKEDLKVIIVKYDNQFVLNMLEKLSKFYKRYFKDALLEKFVYRDYHKYSFCTEIDWKEQYNDLSK
jgi:hypothetical protein